MYRESMKKLTQWKEKKDRKPLIIQGARQVGKTWLMKEFGSIAYQHTAYINFENNRQMEALFALDFNIDRIVMGLEMYTGQKIDPRTTLIIFDEVQEVPQAQSSLKYFFDNAPQYNIVCAGSLRGMALHQSAPFPVGKTDFLNLYPLSFTEFMLAMGEARFVEALHSKNFEIISVFKQKYIELLKQYYFIGGMPEVVQSFIDDRDFGIVRQKQQAILDAYEQDFSKHAPYESVPRIRMLWDSIPAQLAKDNKKFIYKLVHEGARAREYEAAMRWLIDCGLVHAVYRVNKPGLPLKAYEVKSAFKLYFVDVGLLSCMVHLHPKTLLERNDLFVEFKGALTEQYVLQQLKAQTDLQINYWMNDKGAAEVDFLLDDGQQVIPLEVKAEVNLKAKSLQVYRDLFHPVISARASMADYRKEGWLVNVPLYAIEYIREILEQTV